MIPYVEIRDKYSLNAISILEPQECWFEISYQDIGECEIYCRASLKNLALLQKGRYVTIPNKRFVWVITAVKYTFTAGGARMISATGYEAKWLLSRRVIQMPKMLQGTITSAGYGLVNQELGTSASDARKIVGFTVDTNNLLIDISGTQAPRVNLAEFINPLLKQYHCGSIVTLENGKLKFTIFTGDVKTGTVRFSQSLDNLLSSEYFTDDTKTATHALVVSEVDEVDYTKEYDTGKTGIDRAEILVESNISTKYKDTNGVEQETTPNSALYQGWLLEEGKIKLAENITVEEAKGEIDIANSMYEFEKDFTIGDMVKIQDEFFNFSIFARVTKYTFKQDANGYGEAAEYGG